MAVTVDLYFAWTYSREFHDVDAGSTISAAQLFTKLSDLYFHTLPEPKALIRPIAQLGALLRRLADLYK